MECLRACPKDNLALNLRPYGADLGRQEKSSRLDETFLALIMLGSALAFSAVFLGPWGWLKTAAFNVGSYGWIVYVLGFLALNLIVLPGIFILCVWVTWQYALTSLSLRRLIANQAQGLLPLGLMAWIAFTVSFALPKLSYILGVLNDPFGWGWHWLSASITTKSIDVSAFSPILQVFLLLVGVVWSARVTGKLAQPEGRKRSLLNLPVLSFSLVYTISLAWLLVG